jgi:cytochrome c oxidase subunit IV
VSTETISTEHAAHEAEDPNAHDGAHENHDRLYVVIAAVLGVLTAMEVSMHWLDLGAAEVPLLLFLMVVKFVLVVLYFMHLKWDAALFGRLFYAGLFLAVAVYVATLTAFEFFG